MLYRITSPTGLDNHILGTMHLNDEEIGTLPLKVKTIFDGAEHVVFESEDISFEEEGPLWRTLIEQWQKKENSGSSRPPILSSWEMRDKGLYDRQKDGLDSQLERTAKAQGKKVNYFQSRQDIVKAFLGFDFSFTEQLEFFDWEDEKRVLNSPTYDLDQLEKLKQAYLEDDLSAIQKYTKIEEDAPEIVHLYWQSLGEKRDEIIAKSISSLMGQEHVLFVMGIRHVPGIISNLSAQGYTVTLIPSTPRLYPIAGPIEHGQQVAAFKRIYDALFAGQSSFFKSRDPLFPSPNTTISRAQIKKYASQHPGSRSAKAWELAKRYYKNPSATNLALFEQVHRYTLAHSGFFSRTQNFPNYYGGCQKRITEAAPDSRTGKIRRALDLT